MRRAKVAAEILRGLTELGDALAKDERISDKFTVRKVTLDLDPIVYTPTEVKQTRLLLGVSQTLFARFLGVKASTVRSWEQGRQPPGDMAARFMAEILQNPDYWRKRLRSSIRVKA